MNTVDKRVRFAFEAVSELPKISDQLKEILNLTTEQELRTRAMASAFQVSAGVINSNLGTIRTAQQQTTAAVQSGATQQVNALGLVNQSVNNVGRSFSSMRNLIGLAFSISEIKSFGESVIDANTRVNLFRTNLEEVLKSKKLADEISAYALDMAQRSPLKVEQIMEVTQRLVAMGAEGSKVTQYLEMLGEMSSLIGTQKLPLIAKALLDVQNKQKLYAQEVRQFTDNGVPLYQLLADSMDLPIAKVKKLAEQHEISFAQVEKALLDATKQGGIYYGSMARNAEELGGKLSNLQDVIFLAKARFGEFIKEGLGNAITYTSNLIKSLTGTDAAMERTINGVKAITAAVITYTLATRAAAAAVVAKELIMRAYTIAVGTSQMAIQSLLASMGAYITINTAATTAARTFWASLAANPIGLVISAVGIATTAYYTWKATTSEMSKAQEALNQKIAQGIAPMELSRIAFQNLAKEVLTGKLNAEQQYNALEKLKKLHPDLLRNVVDLSVAEELLGINGIEVNTNLEYRSRKFEELKEKYPLQLKGIDNLADAEKKLSGLMRQVNNDFLIRIKLLENEVRTEINNEAAIAAVREKVKLEGELGKAKGANIVIGMDGTAIELSNDKKVISEKIKNLDKTIQESQRYNENIKTQSERLTSQINDDWTAKTDERLKNEASAEDDANKKKKAKAILTAKEIAVLTKEVQADSFKEQMQLIDAQMKLDIERVNHTKITKAQAEAAIVEIVAKAEAEKAALRGKYINMIQDSYKEEIVSSRDLKEAVVFDEKEKAKAQKKAEQEKREESRKTVQEWENYQKDIQKITKETADIEIKSRRDTIRMAFDYIAAQGGILGELSKVFKRAFEDIDLLNGKTVESYANATIAAQKNAEDTARIFGAGSAQYYEARKDVDQANRDLEQARASVLKAKTAVAMALLELLETTKQAIVGTVTETMQAVAKVTLKIRDTMKGLYDDLIEMNREALDMELENFKGSYDERVKLLEDFYAKQKQLAEARDTIDASLTFNARMLEINTETTTKISGAWDLSKGPLGPQSLFKIFTAWKEHNAQIQAAAYEREAYEKQLAINRLEFEKQKAKEILDAKLAALEEEKDAYIQAKEAEIDAAESAADSKIEILNTELDTLRDNYNQQVDAVKDAYSRQLDALKAKQSAEEEALRATYELKQQLLEQETNDEIEAVAILDRTRNEALERYRIAEIEKLTATRNRILATLTNEDEKRAVTEEYDRRIKGVHDEVEEAKLDKTKGISLATKQLRAEETAESVRLKTEEKTELQRLDDEYQQKFKDLATERDTKLGEMAEANKTRETELKNEIKRIQTELSDEIKRLKGEIAAKDAETNQAMKAANADYANSVNAANRAIFEATKQMKIAELRAEIAILRGKRNLFNKGKIDSSIDDLTDAIGKIEAINFDAPPVNTTPPQTPPSGGNDPGSGSNPDPGNPNPGDPKKEQYFQGTPYLEGTGWPNGRDTVPAYQPGKGIIWVDKGERIMSKEDNVDIGGRSTTNKELKDGFLKYRELQRAMPSLTNYSELARMINTDYAAIALQIEKNGGSQSSENEQTKELKKLNKLIQNGLVNININPDRLEYDQYWGDRKNTYYNNLG